MEEKRRKIQPKAARERPGRVCERKGKTKRKDTATARIAKGKKQSS
jgi:hypothetical protein